MTILALVHPSDLLGKEVRTAVDRRRDLWTELRLLSDDDDEVGILTEVGGGAAVVQGLAADELAKADCVIFCGGVERTLPLLPHVSPAATSIVLATGGRLEDGVPLVAGANLEQARRGGLLISPHPGIVGTARLLAPLMALRPTWVSTTVIEPASMLGGDALDEILQQTRAILACRGDSPTDIFGTQAAFNLLPGPLDETDLGAALERILGQGAPRCALRTLRGGVFHSMSLSACLTFEDDPGHATLVDLLGADPVIEMVEDPEELGPIRAASRDEILVGRIVREPGEPARYWLWAVFDNLTIGGAHNALAILEAITVTAVH